MATGRLYTTEEGTFRVHETRTGAVWVRGPQEYAKPMKGVWRDGDWQDGHGLAGYHGHGPRVERFYRGANEALRRHEEEA